MKKKLADASSFTSAAIDRRITVERRKFSYANCIPERRSGIDRRGLGSTVYQTSAAAGKTVDLKLVYCQ